MSYLAFNYGKLLFLMLFCSFVFVLMYFKAAADNTTATGGGYVRKYAIKYPRTVDAINNYSIEVDKYIENPNFPIKIKPYYMCRNNIWYAIGNIDIKNIPRGSCENNEILFPDGAWKCGADGWVKKLEEIDDFFGGLPGPMPTSKCYIGYWQCVNNSWTKFGNPQHPHPSSTCAEILKMKSYPICSERDKLNCEDKYILFTTDGGNLCADSSECQSHCYANRDELPSGGAVPYLGHCFSARDSLGCHILVRMGYTSAGFALCAD